MRRSKWLKSARMAMNRLRQVLAACYDHLFAPECAFDPHSGGYCAPVQGEDEAVAGMGDGRRRAGHEGAEGPACNIDGTPMAGDSGVDIYGDPYGAPGDWCTPSFDSGGSWSE